MMTKRRCARTRMALVTVGSLMLAGLTTGIGAATTAHADDADPPLSNLAPTPPMGWNSWNTFGCDIDEQLIRDTADAMVESGMRDAGYEYVNIDDCWMAPERDADGNLQPDPERFPNGIKALADYVHARDMKLGIYSSAGTMTCQGLPASLGHEVEDAAKFAEWEVDYLKYDNCHNQGVPFMDRYEAMGDALAATGRDIVYSLCEWGSYDPWLWGNEVGAHLWRTTGDITDSWASVMGLLDQQVGLEEYSGPNAWNDPDMLEVGNPGLTLDESRAHMSLWALLNSPLIAGNDLRSMPAETLEMLTDPEVLAVNQDWGGIQGHKIRDDGGVEVWAKPMSDGGAAVVLLNRSSTAQQIVTTVKALGLDKSAAYTMKDVWDGTTTGTSGTVRSNVASHAAEMFIVEAARAGGTLTPSVTVGGDTAPYVAAGESVNVTTTLYNDGITAVEKAEMSLVAPEGWTVEGDGMVGDVPPGKAADVQWTLTHGENVELGQVDLGVAGSWTWRETQKFSDSATLRFAVVEAMPSGTHYLSDVDWVDSSNYWGPVERDMSNGEKPAGDGDPLTIAGTPYEKGLGVHAPSVITYFLGGDCEQMSARVGIDDETAGRGDVEFEVWGDGEKLAASGTVNGGEPAVPLSAQLEGVDAMELRVNDLGNTNYDHADWADAKVVCN